GRIRVNEGLRSDTGNGCSRDGLPVPSLPRARGAAPSRNAPPVHGAATAPADGGVRSGAAAIAGADRHSQGVWPDVPGFTLATKGKGRLKAALFCASAFSSASAAP